MMSTSEVNVPKCLNDCETIFFKKKKNKTTENVDLFLGPFVHSSFELCSYMYTHTHTLILILPIILIVQKLMKIWICSLGVTIASFPSHEFHRFIFPKNKGRRGREDKGGKKR